MYIAFIIILWVLNRNGISVPTAAWVILGVVTAWKWMMSLNGAVKKYETDKAVETLIKRMGDKKDGVSED